MRNTLFVLFLSVLLSPPLLAKKAEEKAVVADTPEKFQLLVVNIREEMAPDERYEFLSTKDRDTVNHRLDLMEQMLIEAGSVANMNHETQVKLFSMQEEVNGILARNADDRLVCTHVAPVGSHIPKTKCMTARQAREIREGNRKAIRRLNETSWGNEGVDNLTDRNLGGPGG
jgi:hypothetical protein